MKIKSLWGFIGSAEKLGADHAKVKAGQVFEVEDEEYAHQLIGKGLAVEVDGNGKPKLVKPKETKPAAPAEDKAAKPEAPAKDEKASPAAPAEEK